MPTRAFLLALLLVLPLSARATPSLLVDAGSYEVLHAEDAGHAWYPASVTKLMTAFVAFETLRAGQITLETDIVFSKNALAQESVESKLTPGSSMSLEDALYAMLGVSANDAAVAIAENIAGSEAKFVERMNETAQRLQMTGTHFVNPEGLFHRDHISTARDLALLAIAIDRSFPEYLPFFGLSEVQINNVKLESRNLLLTHYAGAIGLKTGFVCASGRNLVSLAERDGRRLVAVVLGATTDRERNERTARLLQSGFEGDKRGNGLKLADLPNDPSSRPEDMRMKLCSPKAAAYEQEQVKRYPMGLPGHPSYLSPATAPKRHVIRTRAAPPVTATTIPQPPPRPVTF